MYLQQIIKTIHDVNHIQLCWLNTLSLASRRLYADIIFIYKCLHDHINCPTANMGMHLKSTVTIENGFEVEQICPYDKLFANLFHCRVVRAVPWRNRLLPKSVRVKYLMFLHMYCASIYLIYKFLLSAYKELAHSFFL